MNASILTDFRLTMQEKRLGIYGISLYHQNSTILSHRWRSNDRVHLVSGAKSFTAIAIGICQDEGRLLLSDPMLDYFPQYRTCASEGTENITIRDLLHMSSGKEGDSGLKTPNGDCAKHIVQIPVIHQPGSVFRYSSDCTYLLSRIVQAVSGAALRDYLMPRFFDVLAIDNPLWATCPQGHHYGAYGLYLTTEEYLRLGILLLRSGMYGDKPVVSSNYLAKAVNDILPSKVEGMDEPETQKGYGYQLWRGSRGTYRADGAYGQYCIVAPKHDAVIAITSHEEADRYAILHAAYTDILDRL